ncbi:MAG: hypothetical protein CM1200mP30_30940 [Pseudomonadota bacterium]|nr:MAG: hypothetical protein CM1200mP30_30940 [Pseudomonadota bacterium]
MQAGNPKKHKIISDTGLTTEYSGHDDAKGQAERKIGYEPLAPGFLHVPPLFHTEDIQKLNPFKSMVRNV